MIPTPAIDTSADLTPAVAGLARLDSGIEIHHEVFEPANPNGEAILLVMGLGSQMVGWRLGFVDQLLAEGFRVVRFDNRDVGLSSKTPGLPPDILGLVARFQAGEDVSSEVPYLLSDMADDAIGLLDHLGIDTAHVVGASMGGMIVQQLAIDHPDRLGSVTSIMSTTGNPEVGQATPEAQAVLFSAPATDRDGVIEAARRTWKVISGPLYDGDVAAERAAISFDRCFHPAASAFQITAIAASGDRTEQLGEVELPFLVIHGRADTLVTLSGGLATAEAVPGADLVVLSDMGHDLPTELWPQIVGAISDKIARARA